MATYVPDLSQAIILEVIDNIGIEEYLNAIGKIIDPREIISASQESKFICVFLSSSQLADTLVFKHKEIDIKGRKLKMKPLQDTIIALESVYPIIPNDLIKQKFQEYNIEISKFQCHLYNTTNTNYSHVRSFKRYVTVNSSVPNLPATLNIEHGGFNYAIKVAILRVCSTCNKKDHIATYCNFVKSNPEKNLKS